MAPISNVTAGGRVAPRIALLADGMTPYVMGGMQRHSRLLAENLARAGVRVTVFHTAYSPEACQRARVGVDRPDDPWRRIDVRFIEYPQPGRYPGHYIRDSWRYSTAILDAFVASRPDVDFIYAQGLTGLAFTRARRRGTPLPPVGINAHGYPMFQKPAGLRGRLDQMLLRPTFARLSREADFVFTFGGRVRGVVTDVLHIPEARILEIPNAIDDSWIASAPPPLSPRRRFLFVGRHDRVKGLVELHRALVTGRLDAAEFHFVGPIPERDQLRAPHCIYHGCLSDPARLQARFDNADVLLCPSHAEGMPTVILEALARGLAVIATDVGAVRSMVDASNGIVLERPDPNAIAEAILRLIAAPEGLLQAMKQASLAKAPQFGWRCVTARTIEAVEYSIRLSTREPKSLP